MELETLAEVIGVAPRSLRRWKRDAGCDRAVARPGRRPAPRARRWHVARLVRRELQRQGWTAGEGPIAKALAGQVTLWEVRQVLAQLKAKRRERARRARAQRRTTLTVLLRDAVWAQDATHVGRDERARAVQAEVVRDLASTRTIGLSTGLAATWRDVIGLLEHTIDERGGAPLVWLTDNGSAYCHQRVDAWCAQRKIVHLRTLPHTPQHNAHCERGHRDLKSEAALDGLVLDDTTLVAGQLNKARDRLDGERLRASRGWRTAIEVDEENPRWTEELERERFVADVACAKERAVLHCNTKRTKRLAEREAILSTLERYCAIQRTRAGGAVVTHSRT